MDKQKKEIHEELEIINSRSDNIETEMKLIKDTLCATKQDRDSSNLELKKCENSNRNLNKVSLSRLKKNIKTYHSIILIGLYKIIIKVYIL